MLMTETHLSSWIMNGTLSGNKLEAGEKLEPLTEYMKLHFSLNPDFKVKDNSD